MPGPKGPSVWTVTVHGQDAYEGKLSLVRDVTKIPIFLPKSKV
jgi:hypothetical protein